MDILLIKLGALGDVVNTLPLAITLKERLGARIHWVVEPLSLPLVSNHPSVDKVIVFDRHAWARSLPAVARQIRNQRFDICLDLQRIVKSSLLCQVSRSVRRIGFDKERCKEMTWLFPFERIAAADPAAHMVHQYLEFARYLGADGHEIRWDIPVTGKARFPLPADYLVLNIGATKEANRWTPEGFASLADAVYRQYRIPCVLTGAGEDTGMAREIRKAARTGITDLVGRTTIEDLVEVLAGSRAVVSCDTGPMHLGVALGREVIALFGPADPARTGPYRGHVVRKPVDCSPCNRKTCKDPVCMLSIESRDVLKQLDLILGKD